MTHLHYVPEDVEYLDATLAANVQQYLDEIDDAILDAEIAEAIERELQFEERQS